MTVPASRNAVPSVPPARAVKRRHQGSALALAVAPSMRPMSRSRACKEIRSSAAIGSAVKTRNPLGQHPVGVVEGAGDLPPVPSTAAGSPQWAVIGWPGQNGQASPAASSQTVKMKSKLGAPGPGEFVPALGAQGGGLVPQAFPTAAAHRVDRALAGWLPALKAGISPAPSLFRSLGENRAGGIAGAEKEHVVNGGAQISGWARVRDARIGRPAMRGEISPYPRPLTVATALSRPSSCAEPLPVTWARQSTSGTFS